MTFTAFAKFYVVFKWLIFFFITALKDCLTCFCPLSKSTGWGGVGTLMAWGWGDQIKGCPSFKGIPGAHTERERALTFHNWLLTQLNYFQPSLYFFWIPGGLFFFLAALIICGILVSQPRMEQGPLQWKRGVLTTGLPENSPTGLIGLPPSCLIWSPERSSSNANLRKFKKSLPGTPSGPATLSPTTLLLYPSAWNALFLLSGFHSSAWSVYPPHPASRLLLSALRTQSRYQLFFEMFPSLLVRPRTQNTVLMASLAHVYQGAWAYLPWLMSTRDGLACLPSGWYTP